MKILCIVGYYKPAYVYGGPVKSVSSLCEGLAGIGNEVSVITTNANGNNKFLDVNPEQRTLIDGVQVCYYPVVWPFARWIPFYSPAMGRACRKIISEFDVVYLPGTWTYAMLVGARTAQQAGVPYVVSPRGSFMTFSMQQKRLKKRIYLELIERRLINNAAAIHLTCKMEQQQQERWHFKAPVSVIPNGLDINHLQILPPRGELRRRLGISVSAKIVMFVGRLHKLKRIKLMIESMTLFAKISNDTHLLLVGPEGDGSGKLAAEEATRNGIANRVHFTGLLEGEELMQAYSDADILTLLSYRENFGMVVVEGMAAGLPLVVSQDVGLADEIDRAGAGIVVSAPTTAEKVVNAWERLFLSVDLRKKMAQAGQSLVQEKFSAEKVANNMNDLFISLSKNF